MALLSARMAVLAVNCLRADNTATASFERSSRGSRVLWIGGRVCVVEFFVVIFVYLLLDLFFTVKFEVRT